MTIKQIVSLFQHAMMKAGSTNLQGTGNFGTLTEKESDKYEFQVIATKKGYPTGEPQPNGSTSTVDPSWLAEAKKYSGKNESDSKFNKFLSGFWKIVGLPKYATIVGTSFAWCGLFVAAMLSESGLDWKKNGAAAKNWATYGTEINYKVDGIPKGAIIHINHASDCKSAKNNHVGFSDGDCTPEDVKSGTFNMFGGNQGNAAKVSAFPMNDICEVRWPSKPTDPEALKNWVAPRKITVSKGCKGKAASTESTR